MVNPTNPTTDYYLLISPLVVVKEPLVYRITHVFHGSIVLALMGYRVDTLVNRNFWVRTAETKTWFFGKPWFMGHKSKWLIEGCVWWLTAIMFLHNGQAVTADNDKKWLIYSGMTINTWFDRWQIIVAVWLPNCRRQNNNTNYQNNNKIKPQILLLKWCVVIL